MKDFFGDKVLLNTKMALTLYNSVKDLPIIDYHCHLDIEKIASDAGFSDIGQLWLEGDHYKWRAMRLNGIDERYITGDASWHEKFIKYAQVVPKLIGNPLYYWTHMELKQIFGISKPLTAETAEEIYAEANKKLETLSVQKLLKKFRVEFIATTDDPTDSLNFHGKYGETTVTPTFRPDKLYSFSDEYIEALGKSANVKIENIDGLLDALKIRLDYFVKKGCRISDHGFEKFPSAYAGKEEAAQLFARRNSLSSDEKDRLFGFLLVWLAKEYHKRGMIMQIHFAVIRNNNAQMYKECGADSGFDLIGKEQSVSDLIAFFNQIKDDERPETVLYTLNDCNLPVISAVTGAFRHVRMGAAWWFNDTYRGILHNLEVISEYSSLGNNFGMLTDSRSFSSYCRFDFFRRILCDYVGEKVEKGEYDIDSAKKIVNDICYRNIKNAIENR
ncbi:MAG: glucuronate isomerase [Eubacteriales bacterium]